jgi:polar amino acid transport system permease protein
LLVVRRRLNVSRWIVAAVILFVCALLAQSVIVNKNLDWPAVGKYLTAQAILSGLAVTIELTIICQAIAIIGGAILALMVQSHNPVAVAVAQAYIWFFRGTPVLVQLIFWYNLAILFPTLSLGLPFTNIGVGASTNFLISGFTASIIGLGLNECAYMAEIYRAGIVGVPKGQVDAALSIGLTRGRAIRSVVLPQALPIIIPPTGNQFISLFKSTALVSVIGGGDLLTRAEFIYGQNFQVIPLLLVCCIWYLILTTIATIGQRYLERWLQKDRPSANRHHPGLFPWSRRRDEREHPLAV